MQAITPVFRAIAEKRPISYEQATKTCAKIVESAREAMIESCMRRDPKMTRATLKYELGFDGECGPAQCIIGYGLNQLEIKTLPFAAQSIKNNRLRHVSIVIPIQTDEGQKHFLIDPTFLQFHGQVFENIPTVKALMTDGYVELTETTAREYISSLCASPPFGEDQRYLDFMLNPPQAKENFYYTPDKLCREIEEFKAYIL